MLEHQKFKVSHKFCAWAYMNEWEGVYLAPKTDCWNLKVTGNSSQPCHCFFFYVRRLKRSASPDEGTWCPLKSAMAEGKNQVSICFFSLFEKQCHAYHDSLFLQTWIHLFVGSFFIFKSIYCLVHFCLYPDPKLPMKLPSGGP